MGNTKVLLNVFAQFLGKIGTILASFFAVKIVSGFGTEFYGNYVTAYEFLAFFGTLADAGLFAIAVRDIAKIRPEKHDPKNTKNEAAILGNILSLRLFFVCTATILAGIIAQCVPSYDPIVKQGIWITGLSMALTIIAATLSIILQVRMKIQYFSGSLVLGKILLSFFIFIIAQKSEFFGTTPSDLFLNFLWAGVISNLVFCTFVFYFAKKEIPIQLHFDFAYWKKTLKKSLPYGIALILQTLYLRADLILISLILGASAVGIYGVSARVLESFLVFGVFFAQAILPKITSDEHDPHLSNKTLAWGAEKILIFVLPLLWGTVIFAPQIITLLSSETYLSSATQIGSDSLVIILVPTVFFAFFNQLFTMALIAKEKQYYLLITNSVALGLNIALNLIFLPKFGLIASAVSTVICEAIVTVLLFEKILKYFKFHLNWQNLWIILGMNTGIMSIIYFSGVREHFLFSLLVGGVLYGAMCWKFKNRFL